MAISSIATALPDLILLDIVMPGMSGYELCEHLKADEKTRDIPIIFISALDEVADKVRGFSVGGVDYITKPFQAEEVLARVGTHLTLRELQKRLEAQNTELQEALASIRTLRGMLPICSGCKKIRDDKGYWNHLEEYIERHSDALFSHGLCPSCEAKFYGDQEWYQKKRRGQ
jgi:CheY-like chemotaxis protein